MVFQNENKIYVGLGVLVFCAVLYYFINYQISSTLKYELHKLRKQKYLKNQMMQRKYMQQHDREQDVDSYDDPAEECEYEEEEDDSSNARGSSRLNKDNVLMRDMMGL